MDRRIRCLFYAATYSPPLPLSLPPNHCLCNFSSNPSQVLDRWRALLRRSQVPPEATELLGNGGPGVMEVQEPAATTLYRSSHAHFAAAGSQHPSRAKESVPALDTTSANFPVWVFSPLIDALLIFLFSPSPPFVVDLNLDLGSIRFLQTG
jgi:hypothetical protein